MNIGPCSGCKAKDSEIEFLRAEVQAQRAMLGNMADPLLQARLAAASRPPTPRPDQTPAMPRSPSLLRRVRSDRPPDDVTPTDDLAEAHRTLEASFSKQP